MGDRQVISLLISYGANPSFFLPPKHIMAMISRSFSSHRTQTISTYFKDPVRISKALDFLCKLFKEALRPHKAAAILASGRFRLIVKDWGYKNRICREGYCAFPSHGLDSHGSSLPSDPHDCSLVLLRRRKL